jgi:hypothetical protein
VAGLFREGAVVATAHGGELAICQLDQRVFVETARTGFRRDVQRLAKMPREFAAAIFANHRHHFIHRRPSLLEVDGLSRRVQGLAHPRKEQTTFGGLDRE